MHFLKVMLYKYIFVNQELFKHFSWKQEIKESPNIITANQDVKTKYQDTTKPNPETTPSDQETTTLRIETTTSSNDDDGKITIAIFQISLITLISICMVHLPTVVLGLYGIFCSLGNSKYISR